MVNAEKWVAKIKLGGDANLLLPNFCVLPALPSQLSVFSKLCIMNRAGLRGGQRGQLPRAPRWKGAPRDEIYLFQIKYSFEKFRDSEAIQEYNYILYSYVALIIKGPQQELISLQV